MELIRKSDALHAVLHNQGDAAVAAIQNIKPVLKWAVTDGFAQGTRRVELPEIRMQTLDEWKRSRPMKQIEEEDT